MNKSDVLQPIPTDIMNSLVSYKGFTKTVGKSKKSKIALSSNRTLVDNYESRNDWIASYLTVNKDYKNWSNSILSPNKSKFEHYKLKAKSKTKNRSKGRKKNVLK